MNNPLRAERTPLIALAILLISSLVACNKQRCPDFSEDLLGTYAVNDSILVPPEVEWYDRSYTIELTESSSGRHCVRIENFAFKNNTFTGEVFAVEAEIDVDVLTVVDQEVIERIGTALLESMNEQPVKAKKSAEKEDVS